MTAGVVERVGRGIYVLPMGRTFDEFDVAAALYPAGVLSHRSAFVLHGITEALPRVVTLTMAGGPHERHMRRYLEGVTYEVVVVTAARFFGHETRYARGTPLCMTDLERTLLDGLLMPRRCGGTPSVLEAFPQAVSRLDAPRFLDYIDRLGIRTLAQRAGAILSTLGCHYLAEALATRSSRRRVLLDPHGPPDGPLHPCFSVVMNVPLEPSNA